MLCYKVLPLLQTKHSIPVQKANKWRQTLKVPYYTLSRPFELLLHAVALDFHGIMYYMTDRSSLSEAKNNNDIWLAKSTSGLPPHDLSRWGSSVLSSGEDTQVYLNMHECNCNEVFGDIITWLRAQPKKKVSFSTIQDL